MFNIEFLQGDRNSALNDLILLCGLLAGIYPAYYLSSLDPVNTMKGLTTNIPVNSRFRRILVIFQFVLSVLLIICTLIVQRQLKFMQSKDLGFDRNNISYFMFPTRPGEPKLKTLKKELLSSPDIESVTMAWNPLFNESKSGGFSWTGKKEDEDVLFHIIESEEDYAKVYKLEIADGRFFSDGFSTDANAIVINEQAARAIGFKNATGETIINSHGTAMKIIGVVKDFHFQSLHYKIEPLIMKLGPNNNLYVRMKPGKTQSAVDFIKKTFKSFDPGLPIGLHFLDDDYNELYRAERRISEIFGYFTFLAVIISCLGLIGLSSFMTERRTKEVGIRKINWAKSAEVFLMLAGEYIGWVIIAVIIACPLAWYAMHGWLQSFAYRLPISAWVFALAGALALLIAFLTVGFQSLRAANKNPVEALRYE
jgi:ABC-type antimicrobial peptide transport system permease subunit